ncbi:DUF397 domain-containing protein [Streptomyces sp. Act143]|uniref:DUF397 domain-containing protein n=1 Tax=Streptomyces sp. Act143 TaxID=2200760 RepID=UPI000D67B3E2|nr:DUF397 domain-containing protein [Streptomyces sp. Act143]PWI18081.1 DUF397 domain-containing protein [Streptomyces sp. Act143]
MQTTHWQKSTYSGDSSNCVEIAAEPSIVRIRDSKNAGGSQLAFPSSAWTSFISHTASGSINNRPPGIRGEPNA